MKKFLAVLLLLVSANAIAQYRHHGHHGHYGHRSSGNWVAPLIGGVIVGAILTDAARANQPPPPVIIQQPIPQTSTYNCLVQVYDPITRTIKNEVMLCVNQ